MRFAAVFFLASATTVSASAESSLFRRQGTIPPGCAIPCLVDQPAPIGDCSPLDNLCLCNNPDFTAYLTTCFANSCPEEAENEAALAFMREICESVGVTLG
ncbi:hypothetical protein BKA70DRAFT_1302178 [Coprinopsis sp. MPI-PUGE-AT-0042]|nr:hypothetical protein BKA70DRAFT_1302178 [Coprinopsis sp. MPI-PUGE-AT-0042]